MAFRLYIVPLIGSGASTADAFRPKYFKDGSLSPQPSFDATNYGFEPWFIVGADLSVSQDAFVIAQADAFALPFDLNQTLTAPQVTNVQNKLEAINLPAGWVNTTLQWITVVRIVLGMFSFMQRLTALLSVQAGTPTRLFVAGVSLATTIGQLQVNLRTALQTAADSFKLDTSAITGATTIRATLKILADQFSQTPYVFGAVTL